MEGSHRRNAFTLIELLVVVAIIALLVAILLPALEQARELSAQAVCAHNTKQHALAFVLYEADYGGLPGWNRYADPGGHQSNIFWSLGPYLGYDGDAYCDEISGTPLTGKGPDIYRCPAASAAAEEFAGYGFNCPNIITYLNPATGGRKPWRIDQIPRPAETIAIGDGGIPNFGYYSLEFYAPFPSYAPDMDYDGDGVDDTNTYLLNYFRTLDVEMPYNGISPRHGDRMANMAFLDGHAEPMFINDLMDPDRRLWGEDLYD